MTALRSLADGARLALFVGFTLAVVNGLWTRFSPAHHSLGAAINARMGNGGA